MKKYILHKNHLRKKQFFEALVLSKNNLPENSKEVWIYYKLGFYKTINNTPHFSMNKKEFFARIVSLSACGEVKKASELLDAFLLCFGSHQYFMDLASALASYAPTLALNVLEKEASPSLLKISLLINEGREKEALLLLDDVKLKNNSEVSLYLSNVTRPSAGKQLSLMNDFLHAYALPTLQLKDISKPPSTRNITVEKLNSFQNGPLVSILMTAYNSEEHIKSAIESLLNQTYTNLEIIVIDDTSDDDTAIIVKALARTDERVKYIYLPVNVGTFVAKSIGLKKSEGEFVTCHDSDDWAHPMKIEEQVKPLLKNKKLVFTTSQWVRLQEDGVYYARALSPLMRLNPASPLFRKKIVLEKAGAWDLVRTGADSEFFARLKLVFGKKSMHRVKKPLTFGSHRSDSLMNAKDTGYCSKGMSPTRLDYWEAWGNWHIKELRAGRKPFISTDLLSKRKFDAPLSIMVDSISIETVLNNVSKQLDDE